MRESSGLIREDGKGMPEFQNMKTWTGRFGHTALRSFTDDAGHFWLEQNAAKVSKWAKLAREGHEVAWEFDGPGGAYTGRLLIDGEIFTPREAINRFFQQLETERHAQT
jgi:hypothetical protein